MWKCRGYSRDNLNQLKETNLGVALALALSETTIIPSLLHAISLRLNLSTDALQCMRNSNTKLKTSTPCEHVPSVTAFIGWDIHTLIACFPCSFPVSMLLCAWCSWMARRGLFLLDQINKLKPTNAFKLEKISMLKYQVILDKHFERNIYVLHQSFLF